MVRPACVTLILYILCTYCVLSYLHTGPVERNKCYSCLEIELKRSDCVSLKDTLQIRIETEPGLLVLCLPTSVSICLGTLTAWGGAAHRSIAWGCLLGIMAHLNASMQFRTCMLACTWTFVLIFFKKYSFLSFFSFLYSLLFLFT